MNTSKLITFGAVAAGLYLLYEWMISQCESPASPFFGGQVCGMLLGTPAGLTTATTQTATVPISTVSATTPVSSVPVSSTPTAAQTLAALLAQTATAANEPNSLSADQWSFYYQQIPGKPAISAAQFESILTSLGLTDATRGTAISAQQFAGALVSNGLSGLGSRPFLASWVPAGAIHGGLYA